MWAGLHVLTTLKFLWLKKQHKFISLILHVHYGLALTVLWIVLTLALRLMEQPLSGSLLVPGTEGNIMGS